MEETLQRSPSRTRRRRGKGRTTTAGKSGRFGRCTYLAVKAQVDGYVKALDDAEHVLEEDTGAREEAALLTTALDVVKVDAERLQEGRHLGVDGDLVRAADQVVSTSLLEDDDARHLPKR